MLILHLYKMIYIWDLYNKVLFCKLQEGCFSFGCFVCFYFERRVFVLIFIKQIISRTETASGIDDLQVLYSPLPPQEEESYPVDKVVHCFPL